MDNETSNRPALHSSHCLRLSPPPRDFSVHQPFFPADSLFASRKAHPKHFAFLTLWVRPATCFSSRFLPLPVASTSASPSPLPGTLRHRFVFTRSPSASLPSASLPSAGLPSAGLPSAGSPSCPVHFLVRFATLSGYIRGLTVSAWDGPLVVCSGVGGNRVRLAIFYYSANIARRNQWEKGIDKNQTRSEYAQVRITRVHSPGDGVQIRPVLKGRECWEAGELGENKRGQ